MRKFVISLCAICCLLSCKDELSSTYSTKYPVRFYFEIQQSTELYNAIGNPGQFVTIKSLNGKVRIATFGVGGNDYSLSKIGSSDFEFGLGGLIVGTTSTINMSDNYELVAYDLSCPNCDRQSYRLTLHDNATAECAHCGVTYDLNNYGWILSGTEEGKEYRGLYRYRIYNNGTAINVNNR